MTAPHLSRCGSGIHLDSTAHLMGTVNSQVAGRLRLRSPLGRRRGWLASAPLGAHPAMTRLVLHRYVRSLATRSTHAA